MTSEHSDPPATLILTARDAQWIAAALAVCSTLLGEYEHDFKHDFEHNADALLTLYEREYSASEVNAINYRVRELIPLTSPMRIVSDGPFLASTSTLVS